MKFHSEFEIKKLPDPIGHQHNLLLIGSCFTENIGEKLKKCKFNIFENPNGILFNPVSVTEAISSYIENREYTIADLFQFNEGWHSWKHHSRFSGLTETETLDKINNSTAAAHKFLKQTDYLFITLGSAWVYELTEKAPGHTSKFVAANNHKAPAEWFTKRLLKTEEVLSMLDTLVYRLLQFNPKAKIIFTISPVRHLREGMVENNRSKAVLIQSVHHIADKFNGIYYFPAYELVIDDLRDYRFYSEDLVHPNYFATQYVWEKMTEACMTENTKKIIEEINSIQLAFNHKAFNPSSEQHLKFKKSYLLKTRTLQDQLPNLDFSREIAHFSGH